MAQQADQLRGKRILIVEDESLILLTLQNIVEGLGCILAGSAFRSDAAIAIIAAGPVDAALLDVNLGNGQTSYPVAEVLAARGIPFAFLTGYGATNVRADYNAPVLPKPIDERNLEAALRRLIGPDPVAEA